MSPGPRTRIESSLNKLEARQSFIEDSLKKTAEQLDGAKKESEYLEGKGNKIGGDLGLQQAMVNGLQQNMKNLSYIIAKPSAESTKIASDIASTYAKPILYVRASTSIHSTERDKLIDLLRKTELFGAVYLETVTYVGKSKVIYYNSNDMDPACKLAKAVPAMVQGLGFDSGPIDCTALMRDSQPAEGTVELWANVIG
jgi:uncharacterized protein YoxC